MKILIIGSGGREHALAWKLTQSPLVTALFCAPGNGGTSALATNVAIPADDVEALLAYAKKERIDLTVVGPEGPLAAGIVDTFKREGLKIFGPTREAAELEASKVYAKNFCTRFKIPTAQAASFVEIDAACAYLATRALPVVVKADGLAAGKGVFICHTLSEAEGALRQMLVEKKFNDAGSRVVVEEFLEGEEASFLAFSDGNHVLPLASSQDHKRIGDGDTGPNTGGMGAYSPAPVVTHEVYGRVMDAIMLPTVRGMVTEGRTFTGVLYAGLMINHGAPKVLEYNVRFGDPETQPLIMRLKTDLARVLIAAVDGTLNTVHLEWDPRPAVCVVMAAKGYPEAYEKGHEITGIDEAERMPGVCVFHAGTARVNGRLVTAGGRVLGVTALGDEINDAIVRAYAAVEKITWEGCYYRRDIGCKAMRG